MLDAISGIALNFAFEKINAQIINKIPYALIISCLIFLFPLTNDLIFSQNYDQIKIAAVIIFLIAIFFIFSTKYNSFLNAAFGKQFFNFNEFRKFIGKISNVYMNHDSAVIDVIDSSNSKYFFYAALAGSILTIIFTVIIMELFMLFSIEIPLILTMVIFSCLYIYQDICSDNYEIKKSNNANGKLTRGIIDQYFIQNSLDSLKIHNRAAPLLYIFSRLIGPVTYLKLPKFTFEESVIYKNNAVKNKILSYTDENSSIEFIRQEGMDLDSFIDFTEGSLFYEIIDNSLIESFPYLFNPEFDPNYAKGKIDYILFEIVQNGKSKKNFGYISFHQYSGLKPITKEIKPNKSKIRRDKKFFRKHELQPIYLIMYFGDEDVIPYIKHEFEMISTKYNPNMFS